MRRYSRWRSPVTGLLFFIGLIGIFLFGSSIRGFTDLSFLPWFQKDARSADTSALAQQEALELRARLSELETENKALRQTVNVVGASRHERVLSRVLWRDPDPARRAARVSMTQVHPFVVGDVLVAPGDVLVGKVTAVYRASADVLLINDPEFRISVHFGDVVGTAFGNGREGMQITFVPASSALPGQGTAVYSAGLEGEVPQNIFIGWLRVGETISSEPFAELSVMSASSLRELDTVAVLRVVQE